MKRRVHNSKTRKTNASKLVAAKASPRNRVNTVTGDKAGSKQDAILALLRKPGGATIATLVDASGWQQHSIRGFLAGTVRKKLGLNLVSEKTDDARRYRIGK